MLVRRTSSSRHLAWRRRDVAVLKSLGFVGAQVRGVVVSQALATIAVGLVLGVPLGVAVGRFTWDRLAADLGIVSQPRVSPAVLALVVAVALAIALVVSVGPSRAAARLRPALELRSA